MKKEKVTWNFTASFARISLKVKDSDDYQSKKFDAKNLKKQRQF